MVHDCYTMHIIPHATKVTNWFVEIISVIKLNYKKFLVSLWGLLVAFLLKCLPWSKGCRLEPHEVQPMSILGSTLNFRSVAPILKFAYILDIRYYMPIKLPILILMPILWCSLISSICLCPSLLATPALSIFVEKWNSKLL